MDRDTISATITNLVRFLDSGLQPLDAEAKQAFYVVVGHLSLAEDALDSASV
jgi:hypothetical protein